MSSFESEEQPINRPLTDEEITAALENRDKKHQALLDTIAELTANMEAKVTSRGFYYMPEIPGSYGGTVRVYESSVAGHPHIWLQVTRPSNLNNPDSELIEAVQHMPVEGAKLLRDQLDLLIQRVEE